MVYVIIKKVGAKMKFLDIRNYRLIVQDTSNKLELGTIYKIKNLGYGYGIVSNACNDIILYAITRWQLDNMFELVN